MHLIKTFSFLFMAFLLSMSISACGSRGDLYQVSESQSPQQVEVKTPQSNSENSQKKQP